MKARTIPRASWTYSGSSRDVNAASDQTATSSDSATDVPATELADATTIRKYEFRLESDMALLTLDTIARGSLSAHSFARYLAYKRALLSSDPDLPSVSLTLIVFIQGLYLERADTTLH